MIMAAKESGTGSCSKGQNGRSEMVEEKSKAPPSKTEGRAPKIVLGFVVRATRPHHELPGLHSRLRYLPSR
jgi:hypothetical protein